METAFTASRFDICIAQTAPLTVPSLKAQLAIIRDSLGMSCEWAAADKPAARDLEKALLSDISSMQKDSWTFTGTLHFLSTSPAFVKGRDSWIALFTAVQNGDSVGMTAALHQLEPLMKN